MKTLLLSMAALLLCSSLYAQQWEKIQYPEIYYNTNAPTPRVVVNNNIIYAVPNSRTVPLYTSKDNGSTWQMCDTNALRNLGLISQGSLNWYIRSIDFTKSAVFAVISNFDENILKTFLGLSRDNGHTWQLVDLSSISQNAIDSHVLNVTADNETVIVNTGKSVNTNLFISTDEGNTWKEMGLPRGTVSGGKIGLFQNSFMYDGWYFDGKELVLVSPGSGRFFLIPDINNPKSQILSDYPTWVDYSNKEEEYVYCDRLAITGHHFTCDGNVICIDGKWQYTAKASVLPDPMSLMKDIEYYEIPYFIRLLGETIVRDNYNVLGSDFDTPGNIFYSIVVRRKSDSALLHRYVKLSYPYHNEDFTILGDDIIVPKEDIGFIPIVAATDNAVIVGTSKNNLRRFQKPSVSVEEQVPDADNTMTLQPHPAKDQITISFHPPQSGLYHCELHDMMGAKIVSLGVAALQKGQQWNLDSDIHSLPNGYYRAIVKHATQVFTAPCLIHK